MTPWDQQSIHRPLFCGAAVAVFACSTVASAQEVQVVFDLPAQPLARSLDDVARLSGVDVLYVPEAVAEYQAAPIRGRYTAFVALERLTTGSALAVARNPSGALVVRGAQVTGSSFQPDLNSDGSVVLEEIVVTGSREAREDALSRKRRSDNFREVATSDDTGKLPDNNLADALSRLPGVSVTDSNGEGRFVSIRGIPPELNMVTVNGQPSAVPDVDGRAGRAGPLDVIGAGDFATVEVIKSLRPDLDAQGLGGAINVNVPSAFSRNERFGYARAEKGFSSQTTDADIYAASAGFADRFADGRLGVYLGGSYATDERHNENLVAQNWAPRGSITLPDRVVLDNVFSVIDRYALSANVEYRPNARLQTFLRSSYNNYRDDELRPQTEIRLRGAPVFTTTKTGTSSSASVDMETRQEITDRYIFNLSGGFRQRFGEDDRFRLESQLTYSKAGEENPVLNYYEFNLATRPRATFDASGTFPVFDLGVPRQDPAGYQLEQLRYETSLQREELYVPSVDFTWRSAPFGLEAELKVGAKATLRDRFIDDNSIRYRPAGGSIPLTGFADLGPNDYRGGYVFGPRVRPEAFDRFFAENPGRFALNAENSAINSAEDD